VSLKKGKQTLAESVRQALAGLLKTVFGVGSKSLSNETDCLYAPLGEFCFF